MPGFSHYAFGIVTGYISKISGNSLS